MTWLGKVLADDSHAGRPVEFTLSSDGEWSCSDPDAGAVVDYLTGTFHLRNYSPADGQPGAKQVHAAADWLRGFQPLTNVRVEFPPRPEEVPGRVY